MREILFRGKREYKDKEWAFGSLHSEYGETDKNGQRKIDYRILGMRGECDYVLPETVGQFTGLTDKNGKKIFEGDIIKVYSGFVWTTVVLWDDVWCQYTAKNNDGINMLLNKGHFAVYEVIGNIHDNPELLGGENDG